jgi:flagellar assembly protein FliH
MSSLPDVRPAFGTPVLRGERAGCATTARFAVDLRVPAPASAEQLRDRSEAHAEARASGYAAGWAEGRRAAAAAAVVEAAAAKAAADEMVREYAVQVKQAVAALAAAARRLDQRATPGLAELEEATVATAFAIAEAIVGRELATAADPGMDALQRALGVVPDGGPVTVRLHPADLATVVDSLGSTTEIIDGRTVTLGADAGLRRGDATAECDTTTVEVRIAEAIDRVRAELFGTEASQ